MVDIQIEEMLYDVPEHDVQNILDDYNTFISKWKLYLRFPEGIQRMD